jgi:transposase-like protein
MWEHDGMEAKMKTMPKTLQGAILFFSNPDTCIDYVVSQRWPRGVECPTCGRKDVRFIATRHIWECKEKHPRKQFSVKVGTIFEDSAIRLDKWLVAVWMIANCKNGVSSYELARSLGVTQKTAWFMLHRVRLAMQSGSFVKMGGSGIEIEVDETYIGGKSRNMHLRKRAKRITATGIKDKTPIMGILERGGEFRGTVIDRSKKKSLKQHVREHIAEGTTLYTDSLWSYRGLDEFYAHAVVDHAKAYVVGNVHTNGIENFWSLLKRGINGTYVSVEPFHLFRYLDEQVFRYNNRKKPIDDATRFERLSSRVVGKRLTYAELTGKVGETTH